MPLYPIKNDLYSLPKFPKTPYFFSNKRKHPRFNLPHRVRWDFFTAANGAKSGYLANLSKGGCLLRTQTPIEHRRWIRMIIKNSTAHLYFSAIGRVIRCTEKMEAWGESDITLYRFGVQFQYEPSLLFLNLCLSQEKLNCTFFTHSKL